MVEDADEELEESRLAGAGGRLAYCCALCRVEIHVYLQVGEIFDVEGGEGGTSWGLLDLAILSLSINCW